MTDEEAGSKEKDKGFSKLFHEVVDDGFLAKLSHKAVRIYMALLRYANYNSLMSYPSLQELSRVSGVSKGSVVSANRELVLCGLIEKARSSRNFGFRNVYRIIRHPKLRCYVFPAKVVKRKKPLRGKDGRFIKSPSQTESNYPTGMDTNSPSVTVIDAQPPETDKKKNLEKEKKETLFKKTEDLSPSGSAAPFQGSPDNFTNSKKSLKDYNKENLEELLESMGEEKFTKYWRGQGHSETEIEAALKEIEKTFNKEGAQKK